jgi:GT2 family glycosyltransferase
MVESLLASVVEDASHTGLPVEVIVVDDTPGEEGTRIKQIAARFGARHLAGQSHVGGKRNQGVQEASHEIVLFLDSDVVIRPGTLEAHYRRLLDAAPQVAGCLGKVEFVGKSTFPWVVVASMQLTLPFAYPDIADRVPWGPTANLSVRRSRFLEVGGFDTAMPRYGGEDVDLGLRLGDHGYHFLTAPEAVAEHDILTWSTWRQNIARLWSFGRADYYLLHRHHRQAFVDFPTGPLLWFLQLASVLAAFSYRGWQVVPSGLGAIVTSIATYHFVYAIMKREPGARFAPHLLGPLVFFTMDLAKTAEALRHGRPLLAIKRLKFLDDMISQDWREIAASAWALTAAAFSFGLTWILFSFGQR